MQSIVILVLEVQRDVVHHLVSQARVFYLHPIQALLIVMYVFCIIGSCFIDRNGRMLATQITLFVTLRHQVAVLKSVLR
jgi:hypothetical protein